MAKFYHVYHIQDTRRYHYHTRDSNGKITTNYSTFSPDWTAAELTFITPSYSGNFNATLTATFSITQNGGSWSTTVHRIQLFQDDTAVISLNTSSTGNTNTQSASTTLLPNTEYYISFSGTDQRTDTNTGAVWHALQYSNISLSIECDIPSISDILYATEMNELADILGAQQTLSSNNKIYLADAQAIGSAVSNFYSDNAGTTPLNPITFDTAAPSSTDIQSVLSAIENKYRVQHITKT